MVWRARTGTARPGSFPGGWADDCVASCGVDTAGGGFGGSDMALAVWSSSRTAPETNIAHPLPTYSDTLWACALACPSTQCGAGIAALAQAPVDAALGCATLGNYDRRSHDVPRVRWGGRWAVRATRVGLGRRDLRVSALPGARDRSPGLCVAPSACQGGCRPRPAHCKRARDRGRALSFPRAGEAPRLLQPVSP